MTRLDTEPQRQVRQTSRDRLREPVYDKRVAGRWQLTETSTEVALGAIAALLVDQAGWHIPKRFVVASNIVVEPLPPQCLELNLRENVWQFMRDNWLSNRVFKSSADILDLC